MASLVHASMNNKFQQGRMPIFAYAMMNAYKCLLVSEDWNEKIVMYLSSHVCFAICKCSNFDKATLTSYCFLMEITKEKINR